MEPESESGESSQHAVQYTESVSVKRSSNEMLFDTCESSLNMPFNPYKKQQTSASRKAMSEARKRALKQTSYLAESKRPKGETVPKLAWACDKKGMSFKSQSCTCDFCNFDVFIVQVKKQTVESVPKLAWVCDKKV